MLFECKSIFQELTTNTVLIIDYSTSADIITTDTINGSNHTRLKRTLFQMPEPLSGNVYDGGGGDDAGSGDSGNGDDVI